MRENRVKQGVLRNGFIFYTVDGENLQIEKETKVIAKNGKLYFMVDPNAPVERQPVFVSRLGHVFFVNWYGQIYLLKPFDPRLPYPLTMIVSRSFEEKIQKGVHRRDVVKTAYKYFIKKRDFLDKKLKEIDNEKSRKELRMKIMDLSKRAAKFFEKEKEMWAYYDWMSTYYKYQVLINKAEGKYKEALESLKKAEENVDKALRSNPPTKKLKKVLQDTKEYYEALRCEIEAQIEIFSYNFSDAIKLYERAASIYKKTSDTRSANWCKTLYNTFKALEYSFLYEPDKMHKYLQEASRNIPRELRDEIESWRERFLIGESLTSDRLLITIVMLLAIMYEKYVEKIISHYGNILGTTFEGYVAAILSMEGYELRLDKRVISKGLTKKEQELIKKYGVLEVDIIAYRRGGERDELVIVECRSGDQATEQDVRIFLEKAEVFANRETYGMGRRIKVKKLFISRRGFVNKCYGLKEVKSGKVELINGEKLNEWARRVGIKPLPLDDK